MNPRTYCCYCREPIKDNVDSSRDVICGECVQALLGMVPVDFLRLRALQPQIEASGKEDGMTNMVRRGDKKLPWRYEDAHGTT